MARSGLVWWLLGLSVLVAGCSAANADRSDTGDQANPPAEAGSEKGDTSRTGASAGSAGSLSLSPSDPSGSAHGEPGSGGTSSSGGTGTGTGSGGTGMASMGTGGTGTGGSGSGGASSSSTPIPASEGPDGDGAPSSDPSAAGGGGSASEPSGSGTQSPKAGTLTAGAWDDNLNFDFFSAYRARMDAAQVPDILPLTLDDYRAANSNYAQPAGPKQTLDVSLVIDTTGSMGDEMAYLQVEFSALSKAIADAHPNAAQRWSLVVYRDVGDEYVVRSFDFSDDVVAFQKHLAAQVAGGGGDFPEAPEQALAAVPSLAWRDDDQTARLAFWVADAPNHPENNQAMIDAIGSVGAAGVHLYPVASSGINELTELTMRSAAELTGGRYLFLTDDSGVGDPHKEPTIPCYFVTRLDDAIERMVDIELTGVYREPDPSQVIRTGGNPQSRACVLDSGDSVFAY